MKRTGFLQAACTLTVALLLAACSQDDFSGGQEEPLPEGKYPLKISSVSISAESFSEPWIDNAPETRVLTKDSIIVKWTDGDQIGVQIPGSKKTGKYKVKVDQSGNVTGLEAETELYWENRERVRVKGWYPADTVNDIPLNNQSGDRRTFAYVFYGETNAEVDYQTSEDQVQFEFSHQLSKIRVNTTGYPFTEDVRKMEVVTYPSCRLRPNMEPIVIGSGTPCYIPMAKEAYDGSITFYFEAQVVPGHKIQKILMNGKDEFVLTTPITPIAGKMHTITIYTNPDIPPPHRGRAIKFFEKMEY